MIKMKVESESHKGTYYEVTKDSCTCPSFLIRLRRQGRCKHMERHFPLTMMKATKEEMKYFKSKPNINDAYNKFGDSRVEELLSNNVIIKMGRQLYLLE
jgi:predicted nucleic acid-binding Zn finger protein